MKKALILKNAILVAASAVLFAGCAHDNRDYARQHEGYYGDRYDRAYPGARYNEDESYDTLNREGRTYNVYEKDTAARERREADRYVRDPYVEDYDREPAYAEPHPILRREPWPDDY